MKKIYMEDYKRSWDLSQRAEEVINFTGEIIWLMSVGLSGNLWFPSLVDLGIVYVRNKCRKLKMKVSRVIYWVNLIDTYMLLKF